MDVIAKVSAVLAAPLAQAGYELAECSLSQNKDGLTLHILVDRDAPISLDDIVKVSDLINPLLDEADPIEGPYTLDVASLGAEKPIHLERLEAYEGRYVHLHLSSPYEGLNDLEGTLVNVSATTLVLRTRVKSRTKEISLQRSAVDKANLAIKF